MTDGLRIDRCYCYARPFSELKAVADRHNARTLEELQEHADFGRQCRLCHPYVRQMLATGKTVFSEILLDDPEQ